MLVIDQSYALLASAKADADAVEVLGSDDGRFEVRAQALADGSKMQMLGVSLIHDGAATRLVFDYVGRLLAMAHSDTEAGADLMAQEDLRRKGVGIVAQQALLADAVQGSRRTSVLKWGEGLSLRVKRLDAEDGATFLQLRAFLDTAVGYVHALLTDAGEIVAVVSGRTDQDAWTRIQGELNRQGYEVA
jgi:hypothetical protein